MKIDLEKFWEFVKQWSVGRLMILLLLLSFIFETTLVINNLGKESFYRLLIIAVLLEIFELSANHLHSGLKNSWIMIITIFLSVSAIIFCLINSVII